jgi:HrpA-like RNA helicase
MVKVHSGLTALSILGAIDRHQNLTDAGKKMAALPVDPKFSRAILASEDLGCSKEVIDIVSMLSASSRLFFNVPNNESDAVGARDKFKRPSGDHCTILNAFRAYQEVVSSATSGEARSWCAANSLNERALSEAMEIRHQLRGICKGIGIDANLSCGGQEQPILRSLVLGLIQNTAFIQSNGVYKQVMGPSVSHISLGLRESLMGDQVVKVHPSSVVHTPHSAIFYDELVCILLLF